VAPTTPNINTRAGQEQLRSRGIRPVPQPDDLSRPYWEAARRGELRIQRCDGCSALRHPPTEICDRCGSAEYTWALVSGQGRVYSFIIDYRLMVPGFDGPYVVAQVNPDEAESDSVRIVANIRGCAPEEVYINMPVEVCFEPVDGIALPQFTPRHGTDGPASEKVQRGSTG
jgi:uncharacterized OB-fold protein